MTDKWDSCVLLVPTSPILCRGKKGNYLFVSTKETDNTELFLRLLYIFQSINVFYQNIAERKKSNSGSVFYVPFMSITSICWPNQQ